MSKAQGFNVLLKPYPHTILFFLNMYDEPFNKPKVREALQYAIDRDRLYAALLSGLCKPAHQWAEESHPWFNQELGKKYSYDPVKAKALLTEAGYTDGRSARTTPRYQPNMTLVVQFEV